MGFNFTELEAGEEIVFGPMTKTTTTNVSGSSDTGGGSLSHRSGRTVGVTTQRVIVEDLQRPEESQIIDNTDVREVFIRRQHRQGAASITLVKVKAANGQTVKLDMKGLPGQSDALLEKTFASAEIKESKGGTGAKILLIAAILVGLVIILACVLPLIAGLFVRLFGG